MIIKIKKENSVQTSQSHVKEFTFLVPEGETINYS
jgi:hypothetical protein